MHRLCFDCTLAQWSSTVENKAQTTVPGKEKHLRQLLRRLLQLPRCCRLHTKPTRDHCCQQQSPRT